MFPPFPRYRQVTLGPCLVERPVPRPKGKIPCSLAYSSPQDRAFTTNDILEQHHKLNEAILVANSRRCNDHRNFDRDRMYSSHNDSREVPREGPLPSKQRGTVANRFQKACRAPCQESQELRRPVCRFRLGSTFLPVLTSCSPSHRCPSVWLDGSRSLLFRPVANEETDISTLHKPDILILQRQRRLVDICRRAMLVCFSCSEGRRIVCRELFRTYTNLSISADSGIRFAVWRIWTGGPQLAGLTLSCC
jgi:hypothetical protein